jgi:hypothetical protein
MISKCHLKVSGSQTAYEGRSRVRKSRNFTEPDLLNRVCAQKINYGFLAESIYIYGNK